MQAKDGNSSGVGGVLLGVAAIALAGMVGTIGLLREVGELGPKVGDIVSFDPVRNLSRDMKALIAATPADERTEATCVLDARAIHATGGSLVIEAKELGKPRGYRVHWAGPRTSDGGKDCGMSAELLLGQDDIEILAMAAGGYGVVAGKPTTDPVGNSVASAR